MKDHDFSATILVDKTPKETEEIEGGTNKLDDEFSYHYKDVHRCKMKLTEVIPGKKIVWLVLDNYFNFIQDQTEWKGTKVSFEISEQGDKTQVAFTHIGLVPAYECYDICANAWGGYITGSLHNLIETGKGEPNPKEI